MGKQKDGARGIGHVAQILGILAVLCGAAWWLSRELHGHELYLERIDRQTRGRWTVMDMKLWSVQLGAENENLTVPDPWLVVEHHNNHGK